MCFNNILPRHWTQSNIPIVHRFDNGVGSTNGIVINMALVRNQTPSGNDTDVETDTETALSEIREQNEMRSERVHAAKRRFGNYDYRVCCETADRREPDPIRHHFQSLRRQRILRNSQKSSHMRHDNFDL